MVHKQCEVQTAQGSPCKLQSMLSISLREKHVHANILTYAECGSPSRGLCSRGLCSRGLCSKGVLRRSSVPGVVFQKVVFQEAAFQGLCASGLCSKGGLCPRGCVT